MKTLQFGRPRLTPRGIWETPVFVSDPALDERLCEEARAAHSANLHATSQTGNLCDEIHSMICAKLYPPGPLTAEAIRDAVQFAQRELAAVPPLPQGTTTGRLGTTEPQSLRQYVTPEV
jgi:hypothetical protein